MGIVTAKETCDGISAINLFVTSRCNMRCRFCFGSCKMRFRLEPDEQYAVLSDVICQCASEGMGKITFVGGEPLLYKHLDNAVHLAHSLGMTTCVVSNGARVTGRWLCSMGGVLDWLGLSIDSMCIDTNKVIGRVVEGVPLSAAFYRRMVTRVHEMGIRLKINTTVCRWNHAEDLSDFYHFAIPDRLKVFQALTIDGINDADSAAFSVSGEQFSRFVQRHRQKEVPMVVETSSDMVGSYLMVSPDGRFFDNVSGGYRYSRPIPEVGFRDALAEIRVDPSKFRDRGGEYAW